MSRDAAIRIAIYGKGGSGKTSIASNLAVLFAREGLRTLLVGCDPKADCSHLLVAPGKAPPVLQTLGGSPSADLSRLLSLVVRGAHGVDCLEAGGPEPGKGCAGTGLGMVLKVLDLVPGFFERYGAVIYDVLGDVVCGGFAVPLRQGRTREAVIVVGSDVAPLYAANNVARAVRANRASGARLSGLLANRVAPESPVSGEVIAALARRLGTRVVGSVPADPLVLLAAREGRTVVDRFPDAPASRALKEVFRVLAATRDEDRVVPDPLPNEDLFQFLAEAGAYAKAGPGAGPPE